MFLKDQATQCKVWVGQSARNTATCRSSTVKGMKNHPSRGNAIPSAIEMGLPKSTSKLVREVLSKDLLLENRCVPGGERLAVRCAALV